MLASRLPGILPPLLPMELLEVSMIASIAGDLSEGKLSASRPFRAPHHSASMAALVGGGVRARPGEVSMAHNGVLFLDEFPEFSPQVLDGLRQPIETGEIVIARANYRVSYPSRFQLIAAMNPCRCGMAGEPGHTCRRGDRCASDYQARISGPRLDRMDLRVEVPAVSASDLMNTQPAESSAMVADRVLAARQIQAQRYQAMGLKQVVNAQIGQAEIEKAARLDPASRQLLGEAADKFQFSARGFHRILKVVRTLADLDGAVSVGRVHLAESISYRATGRQLPGVA
jgi:magnesium chelatase family protein